MAVKAQAVSIAHFSWLVLTRNPELEIQNPEPEI